MGSGVGVGVGVGETVVLVVVEVVRELEVFVELVIKDTPYKLSSKPNRPEFSCAKATVLRGIWADIPDGGFKGNVR